MSLSLLRIYNINIEAGSLELLEQRVFSDIAEDAGILHLVQEVEAGQLSSPSIDLFGQLMLCSLKCQYISQPIPSLMLKLAKLYFTCFLLKRVLRCQKHVSKKFLEIAVTF